MYFLLLFNSVFSFLYVVYQAFKNCKSHSYSTPCIPLLTRTLNFLISLLLVLYNPVRAKENWTGISIQCVECQRYGFRGAGNLMGKTLAINMFSLARLEGKSTGTSRRMEQG